MDALLALQLVALTAGTVFAVIAVRGYRGSPWGRVLRPLPFVLALFVTSVIVLLVPLPGVTSDRVAEYLLAVAIVGIGITVYEFVTVMTGRRVG